MITFKYLWYCLSIFKIFLFGIYFVLMFPSCNVSYYQLSMDQFYGTKLYNLVTVYWFKINHAFILISEGGG
jgi:hypothetical protein